MKLISLSLISLSFALLVGNTSIANAQETGDRESQEFCQRFPYNQNCKDFVPSNISKFCADFPQDERCVDRKELISLAERQGEPFYCSLMPVREKKSKKCKILVKNNEIIVYLEQGEALDVLDKQEDTREMVIDIEDVFSFNSQWWLADVASQEESVGMFADIQLGYLLDDTQGENKSNFLIISANKNRDVAEGFSNENIPKILEQLEPWLYHSPDMTAIARQLKPEPNQTNPKVADNVRQLLDTNECPRCNLAGADLAEADLQKANLEGANLEGANLKGANLAEIKLNKAYLVSANLSNANLYKANLENSLMLLSSLANSDLNNADLQTANLKYANLNNANLTEAKLDGIGLNVTQLKNANLANANLTEANLKCANLDSANLKNADLTGANLESCEPKMNIAKGDISNFLLNKAKISTPLGDVGDALAVVSTILSIVSNPTGNVDTSRLNAVGMRGVKFTGRTNLNNANLSGANLTETNLDEANLSSSNLNNATLDFTDLKDTDLSNSNLIDARISNLDLEEALLCNTIMPDVSVSEQGCTDENETEETENE